MNHERSFLKMRFFLKGPTSKVAPSTALYCKQAAQKQRLLTCGRTQEHSEFIVDMIGLVPSTAVWKSDLPAGPSFRETSVEASQLHTSVDTILRKAPKRRQRSFIEWHEESGLILVVGEEHSGEVYRST
jgi:hypothetical protein